MEEARENLREAVQLVLEANRELAEKSLSGHQVTRESFQEYLEAEIEPVNFFG